MYKKVEMSTQNFKNTILLDFSCLQKKKKIRETDRPQLYHMTENK